MDFLIDIEQFVRLRFGSANYEHVKKLLSQPAVSTPRVMRSVLFLSDGSMSMLKHYISEAEKDVRLVLVDAEYASGISEEPLYLRDMCAPFSDEKNLGAKSCGRHTTNQKRFDTQASAHQKGTHHKNISGSVFYLGEAQYSIVENQSTRAYVNCKRRTAQSTTVVRLPLIFVLEQLAESVEITAVGFGTP